MGGKRTKIRTSNFLEMLSAHASKKEKTHHKQLGIEYPLTDLKDAGRRVTSSSRELPYSSFVQDVFEMV